MSAAVIGVVWLQMGLIRTSMRINEERFDKNVHYALSEVVKRLELEEQKEEFFSSVNGFMNTYAGRESVARLVPRPDLPSTANLLNRYRDGQQGLWDQLLLNPNLVAMFNPGFGNRPLEERVKMDYIDGALRQELANRGIDAGQYKYKYHYGLYSTQKRSFIIVDGHFVVEDSRERDALPGFDKNNLYNPEYRVTLYPHEQPAPGELRVYFPNRTNIIWSSLWKNFLGTLLFTSIILFCFAYSLHVIFTQKKLSEMKTDFINNMTHEFKTPIATISLAADSIASPMILGSPDKVKRFANIIKQENIRMNSQVEKVLQMALLDKQDFSLNLSEVDLHEIIAVAIENISLQVEKKEGVASALLEAQKPIVIGDLTHISNIINNLLDNANKYSPDKPEISVQTRNVNNGLEVSIRDRGIGMTKEARKHIFDKFYRVPTGNLHDVKGFGLGLSYVKAMMDAHHGTIEVKSEPGKGSTFTLFFPFQQNEYT